MKRISVTARELAAGAFVLVALAGALYLVYRAVPWARSQDIRFHALLERSHGLRDGSPVRIAGITVGRVTSARLLAGGDARGKVRVDFFVRERLDGERIADLFPEDGAAAASLSLEGSLFLGGQSALAIDPGTVGPAGPDGSRAILAVSEPAGLEAQIDVTLARIRAAADSITHVAEGVSRPDAAGRTLAERLNSVAASLEELIGRPAHDGMPPREGSLAATVASAEELVRALRDPTQGTVGRLVSSTELHESLVARLERADEVLAGARQGIDALVIDTHRLLDVTTKLVERADRAGVASVVTGDDLSGTKLSSMLEAAQRTLADLESTAARLPAAADEASRTLGQGRRLARSAEDTLAGARRHWLLSGLFDEPADPWLRVYDLDDVGGDGE